jgi:GT2 family glycosyltransferase
MDLSIIIVNWNSQHYLAKCLETIKSNIIGLDYETIVIDNASFDGAAALVRTDFPRVRYIQSPDNLGFARANNLASEHARGKHLLFLNPDTEILDSAVIKLHECLEQNRDAGAVGCKHLNSDKTIQINCIQVFPTVINQLLSIDAVMNRFPNLLPKGMKPIHSKDRMPQKVEAVSGACLMTPREVFERVGRFSADYFMYAEDVDLCANIQRAGYQIYYIPDAAIIHHGAGSSSKRGASAFSEVLMRQSKYQFIEKFKGATQAKLYKLAMGFSALLRLTIMTVLIPITRFREDRQAVDMACEKWKSVLHWSLGKEPWAEKLNRANHSVSGS